MRFVSQQVNHCLENEVPTQANFGLVLNKWLTYHPSKGTFVPTVAQDRSSLVDAAKKAKTSAGEVLKKHHIRQAGYCKAMENAGWKSFVIHARLIAPFVSGLGATHPTETGLVLDHTSGMPYIPASGQKGVLRIAHLINSLKDDNDAWQSLDQLKADKIIDEKENWLEDDASKALFGSGGNNDALAGQLTILDAYPLKPPELGEDILNPHYRDYYEGKRGPTEDQAPIPIKFMVVKTGAEFVFRVLLRWPFTATTEQKQGILTAFVQKNIERAITEIGMGAKTAFGFGRFQIIVNEEAVQVQSWIDEENKKKRPWLSFISKIEKIDDWGQLRQTVLDAEIDDTWQAMREVGTAVMTAAQRSKNQNPDKWDQERDQIVADWLQPSGINWQPMAKEKQTTPPTRKDNSALLEQIKKLPDDKQAGWNEYKKSGIKIKNMDKQCGEALKEKFQHWKLKKSKEKLQKKAFDALIKRLKMI